MYVSSISKLSQEDMHYNMDCAFRQFWNDPRLDLTKFTDKETTVDEKFLSELWIPDLVFANSVSSARHHVVKRNALFRIVSALFLMLKKWLYIDTTKESHQKEILLFLNVSQSVLIVRWILKCFLLILKPVQSSDSHTITR